MLVTSSSSMFLVPGLIFLILIVIGIYFRSRFVEAKPNEWLLVIRDGKLVKSGIGLKAYIGLTDSYVKFPSKIERVTFTANNVTKEMQGVIITGFAFWSVFR